MFSLVSAHVVTASQRKKKDLYIIWPYNNIMSSVTSCIKICSNNTLVYIYILCSSLNLMKFSYFICDFLSSRIRDIKFSRFYSYLIWFRFYYHSVLTEEIIFWFIIVKLHQDKFNCEIVWLGFAATNYHLLSYGVRELFFLINLNCNKITFAYNVN